MTDQTTFTADEVAMFYDQLEEFFSSCLGESIHYGYWPDGVDAASLTEAQDRLTALLGEKLALRPEERLLDVGCGTGRPATLLARATGCAITGITISRRQLETAAELARSTGLGDRVRFQYADAMDMPFADGEFDAALALESLLHMPDKQRALAEEHRVLRPGGRLVIADFFETKPIPPGKVPQTAIGVLPNHVPPPLDELTGLVRDAGFEVAEVLDVTEQTRHSGEAILTAIAAYRPAVESERSARIAEQVQHAIPLIVEHAQEHTGYVVLTARKAG
ncbi:methyltransferase type 11 [Saccharopolyspora subtropica]|uniref:27-O-demethylrifamycin SV methyltransferase n=1 Tax=Saccharopolyspora thermophila TaxID=89367 RepID=A0A917NDP2_9PSEU|nr:methyltransferase domain-containing protein [Saccharopolyspora subtropica]GGI87752.1 methyltransferase type 11 [Saccharopolyspora subtropica]